MALYDQAIIWIARFLETRRPLLAENSQRTTCVSDERPSWVETAPPSRCTARQRDPAQPGRAQSLALLLFRSPFQS